MDAPVVLLSCPSDAQSVICRSLVLTLALMVLPYSAAAAPPVVAVFDLKVSGVKFDSQALEQLSEYISTELSASGRYEVVPRAELKRALTEEKRESYRACYDESCQIEVGKELAAEKTVAGSIGRFGKSCIITLKLIDLAKATAEAGGSARGACGPDAVLTSLESALGQLTGRTPQPKLQQAPPPVVLKPAEEPAKVLAPAKASAPAVGPMHPAAKGAADPLVRLETYGDYECPYTRKLWKTLSPAFQRYADTVQVRFRHRPLAFHKGAKRAARGALAAEVQGRFWPMHGCLLSTDLPLTAAKVRRCARSAGVNLRQWKRDMKGQVVQARLAEDTKLGKERAPGTPTSYVNGSKLAGAQPLSAFDKAIQSQIERVRSRVGAGASRAEAVSSLTEANLRATQVASLRKRAPGSGGRAKAIIGRTKPTATPIAISFKEMPTVGPARAKATVALFMDYQCPHSRRLHGTMKAIMKTYRGRVQVGFFNLPLSFHKHARLAAQAALAAHAQGRFWDMHDALFALNKDLSRPAIMTAARRLGLDMRRFERALVSKRIQAKVDRDVAQARAVGARGTPTVFINGRKLTGGRSVAELSQTLDLALVADG